MILKEIVVNNFRVFSGTHRFDLMPRGDGEHKRPIILFGGLNGAGKTSILTAVRLGLYGKQAVAKGITKKEYEDYLVKSIHKNPMASVPITGARIELVFDYARQGVVEEFRVMRTWSNYAGKLHERIAIHKNDAFLEEFNEEQCQAFLNELIPIGVSDLFFFDGEKIADLAEDESGQTLHTAVKKLLGLDIIERLRNDLSLYLRREGSKLLSEKIQKDIVDQEALMRQVINKKEAAQADFERYKVELTAIKKQVENINITLDEQGGAWASTRNSEIQKQDQLIAKKRVLEKTLLDEISGAYPLSFAQKTIQSLIKKLKQTAQQRKQQEMSKLVAARISTITENLNTQLTDEVTLAATTKAIQTGFADLITNTAVTIPAHLDLSDSQIAQYQQWSDIDARDSLESVKALKAELKAIDKKLDNSSLSIERAPEEAQLTESLQKLKGLKSQEGKLEGKIKNTLEEIRRQLNKAVEYNRKIEKLYADISSSQSESNAIRHAENSGKLLSEFSVLTAERRLQQLETEFIRSYQKLARKEDLGITAKIDAKTFLISLFDGQKNIIDRNEISAGEKQIYAIAILEALATTSGRKLPIIIDTPLGRLDSKHRNNLVKNYFPRASHQVIILSTDTEIDQAFYKNLESDISHAYHIDFDEKTKSSTASEGYFWNADLTQEAV